MADDDDKFGDAQDRLGFIRKVYGIMSVQLLLTALVTLLPYLSTSIKSAMVAAPGFALFAAIAGLVLSCALFCSDSLAKKVPTNYILMFIFTLCEAYTVAYICAVLADGLIVLQAASMTAGLVVGLTLYAMTTKHDFTTCGGLLWALASVLIVFSLFSIFFGRTMRLIYCTMGVLIFAIYLIVDTQLILGGEGRYA